MRLAALSVDLDEIGCYAAIHGLEAPTDASAHAIYERALPRLLDLFESERVPATLFAIGTDLAGDNIARIRGAHAAGYEIANHSYSHRYDLTRLSRDEIAAEVQGGIDAIAAVTGEAPHGFRAPGYTINQTVVDVLTELRVEYDSSVFPCPAYYTAKAGAIGAIALAGRASHSIVDDPRVLSAPADPYRLGVPYWTRGSGLVELPIGVGRFTRIPYIGTSVVLSGALGARWLTRAIVGRPLVNLELHGIDLADADSDGLEFIRPHQVDLRKSARDKATALRAAIRTLREAGYQFVTLRVAADMVR